MNLTRLKESPLYINVGNFGMPPNSIVLHGCLDCEHFPRLMLHYKKRKEIAICPPSLSLNSHNNEDARGTIFRLFSSLPPSLAPHLFPPKRSSPFLSLRSASHTPMGSARNGESGLPTMAGSPKHSGNHHRSNSIAS